jgi:hypothetical protein
MNDILILLSSTEMMSQNLLIRITMNKNRNSLSHSLNDSNEIFNNSIKVVKNINLTIIGNMWWNFSDRYIEALANVMNGTLSIHTFCAMHSTDVRNFRHKWSVKTFFHIWIIIITYQKFENSFFLHSKMCTRACWITKRIMHFLSAHCFQSFSFKSNKT